MQSSNRTASYDTALIPIGEKEYFQAGTDIVEGHQVRLRGAQLTGVPAGIHVDGIYAVNWHEYARRSTIGALPEDFRGGVRDLYPDLRLHPVTDAVLDAHSTTGWYVVVVAAGTKPGDWTSTGITFDYTDVKTGDTGSAHYGMRLHFRVAGGATPWPSASPAS
jgi:hypothetical protein